MLGPVGRKLVKDGADGDEGEVHEISAWEI